MKRHFALSGTKHQEREMQKYYILTRPTKLSDLTIDDLFDDSDYGQNDWRKKSRELQRRRWQRLEDSMI
ncbi:MAG: hypothetical protein WD887_03100 [Candidatus Saccharimonadales bacterium]